MNPVVLGVGALIASGLIAYKWLRGGAALADTYVSDSGAGIKIQLAYGIPAALADKIVQVANKVGMHPYNLANVINAESRFDPQAQAERPKGVSVADWKKSFHKDVATGLIQMIPSTAGSLQTSTEALWRMSALQQMPFVQKYFENVRDGKHDGLPGPLDTPQAALLAVFMPRARYAPASDPITKYFSRYNEAENPGIHTVGDYVSFVLRSAKLPSATA